MRLFQCSSAIPAYGPRLRALTAQRKTFVEKIAAFHADGFEAVHTLAPVLDGGANAFYTHRDNEDWQRAWAREQGLPARSSLDDILLAQIEHHRTEVLYANGAGAPESPFLRRLPRHVRAKICFFAGPALVKDLSGYLVVNNFPSLLEKYKRKGLRTAYFFPSHDPALDRIAARKDREIDILFVGTLSRHHTQRTVLLETVAKLASRWQVVYSLLPGRLSRLADTPLGVFGPLRKHRRPPAIRAIARPAVFGRDYYELLGRAKIVLNAAVDISGDDRGNMRCWEALGAATLMVSDSGRYPAGMVDGQTIRTYRSVDEAVAIIVEMLTRSDERRRIAEAGHRMIRTDFSKARQWKALQDLLAE